MRALASFAGATAAVVGAGLVADYGLHKLGCDTLSRHCGRHPWVTVAGLVVLDAHFNWHRVRPLVGGRTRSTFPAGVST